MKINKVWWLLSFIFITACSDKKSQSPEEPSQLFYLLDAEKTKVDFVNEVSDRDSFNILTYRNFYNGGGVAIGDINNDSLPDIYFTANQKKNKLKSFEESQRAVDDLAVLYDFPFCLRDPSRT